jgi:hypothetical protein
MSLCGGDRNRVFGEGCGGDAIGRGRMVVEAEYDALELR